MTTSVGSSTSNVLPQSLLDTMNGATSASSSTSTSSTAAIQNQFLTLLVTQMQNQDPMNPMDNSQVTSQLAQLSTVSGINQLNTTLGSLMSSYQTTQSLQATSLIGQGILAPGSDINLSSSTSVLGVTFSEAVDDAKVVIKDSSGNTVQTIDLGKQAAGTVPLSWAGTQTSGSTAADGSYTFSVQATLAGKDVSTTTTALQYGVVAAVSAGSSGTLSVTATGGLGTVSYANIAQVL